MTDPSPTIYSKKIEMLKSASAVTLSDALKKAEKACGTVGLSHDDKNDEQGKNAVLRLYKGQHHHKP